MKRRFRWLVVAGLALATIGPAAPSVAGQDAAIVQVVVGAMYAQGCEAWTEPEAVDAAASAPAHDTIYTQCLYEFGEDGRWFGFRYDHSLQVSRRFSWRVESKSLSVLIIEVDARDAQNFAPLPTHVMEDRGARGHATFGVSGTFGGLDRREHFYEPPSPALGDEECIAEACTRVGAQYADEWQRRYQDALLLAHRRLGLAISNVIKTKETP